MKNKTKDEDEKFINIIKSKLPISENDFLGTVREIEKLDGITITVDGLGERLEQMVGKGLLKKEETIFGYRYKEIENNK